MSDLVRDKITRWSLEQIHFMLGHLEGFIGDDQYQLKASAEKFSAETGLEKIEKLVEGDPQDFELPRRVLERLTAFFESGFLLQRGPAEENANWWITDLFWRGNVFHLELKDQIQANHLMMEISPLQVRKAQADKWLESVNLKNLSRNADALAYLIKPTSNVAFVLVSNLPLPWSADHIAQTHRLINKSFIF